MELVYDEIRRILLALLAVIGSIPTAVSQSTSCTRSGLFGGLQVEQCYMYNSCCTSSWSGSRCCSSKTCTSGLFGLDTKTCSDYSKKYCCPAPNTNAGFTCCDTWAYRPYSLSSSRSSWSSSSSSRSRSRSLSSVSYWSSWSHSREMERVRSETSGIIAGAVIGGVIFIIIAICVPVIVCRNAAARRNAGGRVIGTTPQSGQQQPYTVGPQIAGAAPAPMVPTYPQYTPAAAPAIGFTEPYNQGQQYPPSTNPAFQPAYPPPPSTGTAAPPPSYDTAMEMQTNHPR